MSKPRAFVIEKSKPDEFYEAATMHGELLFLIDGDGVYRPSIMESAEWQEWFLRELKKQDFDVDKDQLVLVGDMVSVASAVAVIVAEWGYVKALMYDARLRGYRKNEIGELENDRIEAA